MILLPPEGAERKIDVLLDEIGHRVFWACERVCEATGHRFCRLLSAQWHPIGWAYVWAFRRVSGL